MHKANQNLKTKKTGRKLFKRLLPIFMIIPLLVTFTFQLPQLAEANFISKAVSTSAKKIIKEVTKDAAVNEALNIIYQKQMGDLEKKLYEIPDDYEAVCFEHATQKCKKPAAVKKLTTADKKLIGDKVGDLLDQRAGMTPFKKFLDWFAPVFLIGFTVSALQYAFDSDFRSFINDIAMQALYDLGFITPIPEKALAQPTRPTIDDINEDYTHDPTNNKFVTTLTQTSTSKTLTLTNLNLTPQQTKTSVLQIRTDLPYKPLHTISINSNELMQIDRYSMAIKTQNSNSVITLNKITGDTYTPVLPNDTAFPLPNIDTSINLYMPYIQDNILIFEFQPRNETTIYQLKITNPKYDYLNINTISTYSTGFDRYYPTTFTMKLTVNTPRPVMIPLPTITEVTTYTDPLETSTYKKDETKIYIPSPKTQEFTTEDGKKLTPSPTSPGIFIDEQGNEVPDDDVIVSDPKVTPNPDGSVTHTPEPTPENPNPQPEEIVPPKTEPPNNFPFELVIALLKLLKVSLAYMVHIFKFFIGLSTLPEKEIPFEMFQQFKTFKPFNFPIYATVQGMALFFTSFTLYRFIRRMF